jgi:mRNA interferase HicA
MRQYLRIGSAVAKPETNRTKVAARLKRDGWIERHGGDHDVYKHPSKPGRIIVPRHRELSPGVARAIARQAGWQ